MSRSRRWVRRKYFPSSGAKRLESQRYRARERAALVNDKAEDLPAKVAAFRRWDIWSWD